MSICVVFCTSLLYESYIDFIYFILQRESSDSDSDFGVIEPEPKKMDTSAMFDSLMEKKKTEEPQPEPPKKGRAATKKPIYDLSSSAEDSPSGGDDSDSDFLFDSPIKNMAKKPAAPKSKKPGPKSKSKASP
jgi:hypothetical protein